MAEGPVLTGGLMARYRRHEAPRGLRASSSEPAMFAGAARSPLDGGRLTWVRPLLGLPAATVWHREWPCRSESSLSGDQLVEER